MGIVKFDYSGASAFMARGELERLEPYVKLAHEALHGGAGAGSDYTGWVDLPLRPDAGELARIKACAERIGGDSDVLVVIGIGGSYLGARALIDALSHSFYPLLDRARRGGPLVLYAGNSLSPAYFADLIECLEGKELSVNVVSKSGTTTEPAVAFRFFKEYMERKYGRAGAAKRIYATTDRSRGALKGLAVAEGYETFVIPDDIGGRYSVLTAVGLLPIAAAGIDVGALLAGAREACEEYARPDLAENGSYAYAAARNALYRKGYSTELLVAYEPCLRFFGEWWKQLYGESEGKDGKGLFPASAEFTADLHSMGQYIQDGRRNLFETVLSAAAPRKNAVVARDRDDIDGLNFLAGKDLDYINKMAARGTLEAHVEGGAPNLSVGVPALDAESLGAAVYFFEKACAISGYLLGVNPFDQPGVELYKKNMFRLLGKPGH
jgi:glucose-6-phosphate isomerase